MSGACLHWRGKTTGGGSKKIEPLDLERFWTIGIALESKEILRGHEQRRPFPRTKDERDPGLPRLQRRM